MNLPFLAVALDRLGKLPESPKFKALADAVKAKLLKSKPKG